MNSTNNNSFEIAAKKVFSDLYDLIKEDENITTNEIDDKPLEILFNDNIPDLKFIDPNIFNKFKSNINLDCIKNT